jgi:hypothetical protein
MPESWFHSNKGTQSMLKHAKVILKSTGEVITLDHMVELICNTRLDGKADGVNFIIGNLQYNHSIEQSDAEWLAILQDFVDDYELDDPWFDQAMETVRVMRELFTITMESPKRMIIEVLLDDDTTADDINSACEDARRMLKEYQSVEDQVNFTDNGWGNHQDDWNQPATQVTIQ